MWVAVVKSSLLIADVVHRRTQPKENAFKYGVYYLCFPLSLMHTLKCWLLSVGKPNLMSYYPKDLGNAEMTNEDWIRSILKEWGLNDVTDGEVVLVTMPRILGYAFNPVSFWFCLDGAGDIRAVLSEVHNTFGERHCYLSYHDDKRAISSDDWMESEKVFHVSPFMKIEGVYRYRFILTDAKVAVWINHVTDAGVMLYTSLIGRRIRLNSRNLAWCFVRYPLVTFKVIALIHWQAIKLISKGISYHRKPPLEAEEVTR
jgi:uncharacterized protein